MRVAPFEPARRTAWRALDVRLGGGIQVRRTACQRRDEFGDLLIDDARLLARRGVLRGRDLEELVEEVRRNLPGHELSVELRFLAARLLELLDDLVPRRVLALAFLAALDEDRPHFVGHEERRLERP